MSQTPPKNRMHLVRLIAAQLCVLSAVSSALAQAARTPPAATPAAGTTVQPATTEASEDPDTIVLSPFTVQTSKNDIGYYASNTLAGSRLNSKIGDLAAPITVVTKQQLEDTGARDLNDVFLYEANTEGSLNYTPIEVNRSGLKDRIGGSATNGITANTATTANRIRGITTADTTWNFYNTIPRLRADTYNAQSLEISRGPNSILAGLGSPAGILNQTITTGRINVNSNEVNLAVGSYGAYRASFSTNRTLIKDKLAVTFAALYDDREFSRKPSSDVSRRQTGGFTYRPFKKTTIKGFVEGYTNTSRTPNQMTPRDAVSPWLGAGRPVWNPLTRQVTFLDTGVVTAPYLTTGTAVIVVNGVNTTLTGDAVLTDRRSPRFIPGLANSNAGRPIRFVNQDGSNFWSQAQATVINIYGLSQAQVNADPQLFDIFNRRLYQSAMIPASAAYDIVGAAIYVPPSITNKNIYNWEEVNLQATNFGKTRASTYNLEFEQQLTPDLFFSAGWFKQDMDTLENYPVAQLTTTTLLVDTNTHLINGTVNPNYLRPYVDAQDPDLAETPETKETFRAMLAYDLDFTKRDGWMKWLGRHRMLGFASHQEDTSTTFRFRQAFSDPSDPRFLQPLTAMGTLGARPAGYRYAGNASATRQIYYVGNNNSVVSYGPSDNTPNLPRDVTTTANITAYNYTTRQFEEAPVTFGSEWFDAGGGVARSQKLINTLSFAAQSFWWNERIVTTYGIRKDRWSGRNSTTGVDGNGNPTLTAAELYPVGVWRLANTESLLHRWSRREYLEGTTGTLGVVVKPLPWFSLNANRSDNFNPPPQANTDIFGKLLPKPEGDSKDYGFSFNLLDNKLIARVIFFKTTSENERAGQANTLLGRLQRQDNSNLKNWAEMVVRVRSGQNPTADNNWANNTTFPLSLAQQDQVAALMAGLPFNWPSGLNITSTQTNKAKGAEFEVIYNPTPNWNIKFTAGKQETSYANILPEYDAWLAYRLPLWKAAAAPDMAAEYVQPNGTRISLRNFYSGYGFGETNAVTGINGFNPEDWFNKVVAGEVAGARQLEGAAPFGQRKWRANILSNYSFTHGPLKNFAIGGAVRWEDKAIIGYYGVTNAAGQYLRTDTTRPVYDTDVGVDKFKDLTHFDLWFSYKLKLWNDKVRTKIQLNIFDALEEGGLVPVYVNYDGLPVGYRIVDSRRIQLSAKFEF